MYVTMGGSKWSSNLFAILREIIVLIPGDTCSFLRGGGKMQSYASEGGHKSLQTYDTVAENIFTRNLGGQLRRIHDRQHP